MKIAASGKSFNPLWQRFLEHWLRVGRRGADHAENLRGRCLLLTCLYRAHG